AQRQTEGATGASADSCRQINSKVRVLNGSLKRRETSGRRLIVASAAHEAYRARERESGRIARGRAERRVATPLHAHLVQVSTRRLHDAGLDQHLRRLGVQRAGELLDLVEITGHVANDHDVGTFIYGDRAAPREKLPGTYLQVSGLGVTHGDQARLQRSQL